MSVLSPLMMSLMRVIVPLMPFSRVAMGPMHRLPGTTTRMSSPALVAKASAAFSCST